jgi:hypothetical protein
MLALIGCRGAAAATSDDASVATIDEPNHGIDVPADWKELPSIGDAATAAAKQVLGADAEVHAHAWGEPSRGCYLAIVDAAGTQRDTTRNLVAQLEAALTAHVELTEWTASPDAEDTAEINARFVAEAAGMTGLARATMALDRRKLPHAVAAACFYNDRQPALCDNACAPLLAMLQPLLPPQASP